QRALRASRSTSRNRATSSSTDGRSCASVAILTRAMGSGGWPLSPNRVSALAAGHPVDPAGGDARRSETDAEPLAHDPGQTAADRVLLPASRVHEPVDGCTTRRPKHRYRGGSLRSGARPRFGCGFSPYAHFGRQFLWGNRSLFNRFAHGNLRGYATIWSH